MVREKGKGFGFRARGRGIWYGRRAILIRGMRAKGQGSTP